MELWIHDLDDRAFAALGLPPSGDRTVLSDDGTIVPCIGCFRCWTKTPGTCFFKDGWEHLGTNLAQADRVVIISRCLWGSYSPFLRNVFDRAIAFNLPYFQRVNGETHHRPRYPHPLNLTVHFYGDNLSDAEQQTARDLVKANGFNFHAPRPEVFFYPSVGALAGRVS